VEKIFPGPAFPVEDKTTQFPGTKFDVDVKQATGFVAARSFSVKQKLQKLVEEKLSDFTLGAPAALGSFILCGTDNPDAKQHFLVNLNVDTLIGSMRQNPVAHYLSVSSRVCFVQWASPRTCVCAIGEGSMILVTITEDGKMEITGDADGVHTDSIRELAFMPNNDHIFASGGLDRRLCLIDLERRHVLQKLDTTQIVGSVKWGSLNAACVAVTVDNGKYYLFDVRKSWAKPALVINLQRPDLFTNERISENDVLLGFGSGLISHVDLRARKELSHVMDPYVQCVGAIDYNSESNSFVSSGCAGFSVYKHDLKRNSVDFWSHGLMGDVKLKSRQVYTTGASWVSSDIVVVTDSNGTASVFLQDWHENKH